MQNWLQKLEYKIKQYMIWCYALSVFVQVIMMTEYVKLHPQYAAILNGLNRILFIAMMVGVLVSALDSRRNLSILVLTVALLIMEKVVAGNMNFKSTLLLMYLLPIIGFPRMLYLDFWSRLVGYGVVVVVLRLLATHNVYNPVVFGWKLGLGFNNPNTLGAMTMILFMELVTLHKYFSRYIFWGGLLALVPFLFMSRSRTAIWGSMIFLIFILLFKYLNLRRYRVTDYFVVLMPLIAAIISAIFAIWYKLNAQHAWVKAFDLFTSNRLQLGSYFFHKYGVGLFGHTINTSKYVLDTGYLNLLITQGIIITVLFLVYYGLTLANLIRVNWWPIVPAMLAMLFVGLSEGYFANVNMNPFC